MTKDINIVSIVKDSGEQLYELRWVNRDGFMQLQFRTRWPVCDASGAFCGVGDWSEWQLVHAIEDVNGSAWIEGTE